MATPRSLTRQRRRRIDILSVAGAATATLTLAGVGWYWYRRWTASRHPDNKSSDDGNNAQPGESSTSKLNGTPLSRRPTLSVLLPPTLDLTQSSHQEHVIHFYLALSPHYLITLIHFTPQADFSYDSFTDQLESRVSSADVRRIVPYSTRDGANAVARALGCDAHLEIESDDDPHIILEQQTTQRNGVLQSDADSSEKGSNHLGWNREESSNRAKAMGLIRRNGKCRLAVLALLPPLFPVKTRGDDSESHRLDELVHLYLNRKSSDENGQTTEEAQHEGEWISSGNKEGATLRIVDTRRRTDPTSTRLGSSDIEGDGVDKFANARDKEGPDFRRGMEEVASRLRELRSAWK